MNDDNPHGALAVKEPLSWSQFIEWATRQSGQGGKLCGCGQPTCAVEFGLRCPACGQMLSVGIHVNDPTLIIGCKPCGRSMLYIKLER